ncbi:serine/arginine-rich splicing factor SC35-like [Hibiscus syriacus]|uniref:serine/arginine-rich splicing factor SC35-like n=1 Tax=Hibiscus syriacus TaxID=106335 RepID=UPI0019206657|nr:serine/arginine-rich splicing factor SC35-like [Hibiscus syriacus]
MSALGRERVREKSKISIDADEEWTMFIDNLNKSVSRGVLRNYFSPYGQILRIFIPRFLEKPNYKSSTFAFVQYAREESRNKAIRFVNGKWLDGRRVSVGIAKYQKVKRREAVEGKRMLEIRSEIKDAPGSGRRAVSLRSLRDNRSYKDVVNSDYDLRRKTV